MTSSCFTTNYIVTPEPGETPALDRARSSWASAEAPRLVRPAHEFGAMAVWRWSDHPLPAPPAAPGTPAGGPTGVLAGGPTGVLTVGLPERPRAGRPACSRAGLPEHPRADRPGCWQVGQRECCRAVPPERSREPPASRLQPVPPSSSCPGTPNGRRRGQPLHRPAATGPRQQGDRPGRPASRRTREVRCTRRRQHCPRADSWQRARWRTPPPRRAGSPLARRSSPRPEPDRQTVADPCMQSRPLARAVGQRPGTHRPRSPR